MICWTAGLTLHQALSVTWFIFFSSSLQPGRVVTLIEDDDVSGTFCFLLVYSRKCSGVSSLHQLIEWWLNVFIFLHRRLLGVWRLRWQAHSWRSPWSTSMCERRSAEATWPKWWISSLRGMTSLRFRRWFTLPPPTTLSTWARPPRRRSVPRSQCPEGRRATTWSTCSGLRSSWGAVAHMWRTITCSPSRPQHWPWCLTC